MAFRDKFTASFELLRRLLFLVRPYGLGKAAWVLGVMILQGILQVAGVTSIFPFLALATNPEGFRTFGIGQRILALLPPLDNGQLLFWADDRSRVFAGLPGSRKRRYSGCYWLWRSG